MSEELSPVEDKKLKTEVKVNNTADAVYGIGIFGAWVYFIGQATTTEDKIKGFFKGLVWPAFLVYELFKFLEKE